MKEIKMEIKKHFKLYKSGKQWVTAAVATVAVSTALLYGGVARADQQVQSSTTQEQTSTVNADTTKTVNSDTNTDQPAQTTDKNQVANDTTPNQSKIDSTATTNKGATTSVSTLPSLDNEKQSQTYNKQDNGNYGNIDTAYFSNNQLHVSGWNATNASQGTNSRQIIVRDITTNNELGRTDVTNNVARPDVKNVHNVYNADNSGFDVNVNIDFSKMKDYRDSIEIVSRYSGNGKSVDWWSQPITFDKNNYAYLDTFEVKNGELHATGWNATNSAINYNHHFVILFDQTNGKEVARQEVREGQSRPDVAKVYPQVVGADNSGFDVTFNIGNLDYTHQYQVLSRYSNSDNGEGDNVTYWFNPQSIAPANQSNQGYLDSFDISKNGEVTVTGWNATDLSELQNNHYVILFDQTAGKQVASAKADLISRPDVAKAYPTVKTAANSGFKVTFKVNDLQPGHQYSVVSRFSADENGNGNDKRHTDYWFSPVTLNQNASNIDTITMTSNGLHIAGWMASDNSINETTPYAIILNNGKEVTRQKMSLTARPDVAAVYPSLYNSAVSGFDTTIKLTNDQYQALNGQLQVLLRFSKAADGNPSGDNTVTDQFSKNYATTGGNFDYVKVNGNQVEFSGWHATNQSNDKDLQWIIVLVNGKEVKRQLVNDTKEGAAGFNRNDVYKVNPAIENSYMSGFQGIITLPVTVKNENVQLVHRFSNDVKTGEGNYVDFWSELMPVKDSFQKGNGPLKQFGLQTINGQQYYIDLTTGQPRKNFLLQSGNNWIYFDSDTGVGTNALELQFAKGTVSSNEQYRNGNAAYSYDDKSIENVNGYLTADTWYRPKQILKDGTTWTDSKETDMRPILMVWWPNTLTQAYYLNYMKQHGNLLPSALPFFNADTDPAELNHYSEIVQQNIEKRIGETGSTDWLRTLMHDFITNNPMWNKDSENVNFSGIQFQGGFLKYENSDLTPYANSDYRLLDRMPINIDGKGVKGSEFLLANDVDNSNPVVQAEQLNWLYYLLNFGTITANNDQANFDSIRVDAVDNVDADLLNIAQDYFNAAYGMNSDAVSNKHLNILEDWNHADPEYINKIGNPQLTIDDREKEALNHGLSDKTNRWGLDAIVHQSLADRENDSTENIVIPNYTFIRAHDSNAQDQINNVIRDLTGKDYHTFTFEDEQKGIDTYIQDQNSTVKKYNLYNIPSSYAIMLTNKDTIPRVYYGDLYTDGGQYMEHQTRYYDTLTNLLKSRIKYVAGGQSMQTMSVGGNNNILTSVRYGKGAMTATDTGTDETRTQGIGVIVSNTPNLKLGANDKVVLHMGAAHKNQQYRAAVLTTTDGVINYTSDQGAPVAMTDENGDLYLSGHSLVVDGKEEANTAVQGYANPDVSGYLAVWVPVGASDNQDARTAPSTEENSSNSAYRSNAALDSNVIYEGFSNFIYPATKESEYTNVRIAQNTDLFVSLGFTSFQMAPQYNSSKDRTFLDSTIDNGYAFTDRYDLGMSEPNKYGTDEDLRNAIQALHKAGLQVMADWVPDQIYNLPGKEVATVTRVDEHGDTWKDAIINNGLYVVNTVGGGEYQKKYGGAFLDKLQKLYPEIFTKKQVSTGVAIDPSQKITEWSAKYFNGTNILHRGSGYVLKADGGQYYNLGTTTKQFLPIQLTGEKKQGNEGFVKGNDGNYYFYDLAGNIVKNTFIEDSVGNWYFFDQDGKMVENKHFVDVDSYGEKGTYFFLKNGVSFRGGLVQTDNGTYYFDNYGKMVRNQTVNAGTMIYTLDENGKLIKANYNPDVERPSSTEISNLADQKKL